MMEKGLYNKYTIINNETGVEVEERVFILKPDKDPVARAALRAYAEATDNKELAEDLKKWANYVFRPCGCRGLADCSHWGGGDYIEREEVTHLSN